VKERGILFSAPMVRALLVGAKTQTRRAMKPQPVPIPPDVQRKSPFDDTGYWWACSAAKSMMSMWDVPGACSHGTRGDRLWVREAWRTAASLDKENAGSIAKKAAEAGYPKPWMPVEYSADGCRADWDSTWGASGRQRLGRFMPRWASRITLEVTDVRVQRSQDISEEDAKAEGVLSLSEAEVAATNPGGKTWSRGPATARYELLWDAINGAGSWASNPWVWAISFKRVTP